jgi:tRNA uridine 5-carbamoylmethylation protein Kti12
MSTLISKNLNKILKDKHSTIELYSKLFNSDESFEITIKGEKFIVERKGHG